MSIRMQQKRDTALNWQTNNPVLLAGELGIETDTGKLKIGDGVSHWNDLNYFSGSTGTVSKYDSGWFAVSAATTYTKAHGLGAVPDIVQVYWSDTNNGSGTYNWVSLLNNYTSSYSCWIAGMDTTSIKIRTGASYTYVFVDANGTYKYGNGGYYRIIAIKVG